MAATDMFDRVVMEMSVGLVHETHRELMRYHALTTHETTLISVIKIIRQPSYSVPKEITTIL